MATTQENWRTGALLDASRTIFHQKLAQFKAAQSRRRIYRATKSELASLTDRSLRDLGISRADINRLANEAAYDRS